MLTLSQHNTPKVPTVVGLYGVSGCGKSSLLLQLKAELAESKFAFFEGATILSNLVPGGLDAFKRLDNSQKYSIRERAVMEIGQNCVATGKVGVVAGHFIFWDVDDGTGPPPPVWTNKDAQTYTHVLYLDVPSHELARRRHDDSTRKRPTVSQEHLAKWQATEREQLREVCLANGILFSVISLHNGSYSHVFDLLRDIECHTEEHNLACVEIKLDAILSDHSFPQSRTVLVLDGDRTLVAEDTGVLIVPLMLGGSTANDPVKTIFSSHLGYSYLAFRQVSLLYNSFPPDTFSQYCQDVAASVKIYQEFLAMLERAAARGVGAVIITCGLRPVWEQIIEAAGLSQTVRVIGGGRIEEGFVVTGEVKGSLIARLRDVHGKYVCAFGDSVLDLPMLKEADRAIVVVGEELKRSKTMENALLSATSNQGLYACQVLLPPTASPRLDTVKLPLVDITSDRFITSIMSPVILAPEKIADLLMTPMRDATLSGPALRNAHAQVGRYLTISLLSECVGTETYSILHVQGHKTDGYRFRDEGKTSIVALMRGGEPMAFGVNEAMPLAMFVHAKTARDVEKHHVEGQTTIILVDSVVNTGKSIVEFVTRIRELDASVRILVLAGVVQAKAFSRNALARVLTTDSNLEVFALRQSDNKFTGRKTTDTGNRLFNTTHLE